jgi:hypothetical protein
VYKEAKFYKFTVLMAIMEVFVFEHEPIESNDTTNPQPKKVSPEKLKIKPEFQIIPKNIELNIKNNNFESDTEEESSDSSDSSI